MGVDLSSSKIDLNDPKQVEAAVQELLQYDTGITALAGIGDRRFTQHS
jgi:hypothetical protein